MKIGTFFLGAAFGDYFNTIYDEAGTLTSVGYPGGFTKVENNSTIFSQKHVLERAVEIQSTRRSKIHVRF
jgi:hypothetical protein